MLKQIEMLSSHAIRGVLELSYDTNTKKEGDNSRTRINGIEAFDQNSDEVMARSLRSGDLLRYVEESRTPDAKKGIMPKMMKIETHAPLQNMMNKFVKRIEFKD